MIEKLANKKRNMPNITKIMTIFTTPSLPGGFGVIVEKVGRHTQIDVNNCK